MVDVTFRRPGSSLLLHRTDQDHGSRSHAMHSEPAATGTGLDGRFDALWREHRFTLLDLAYKMLGNFGDAEDAVQEAFSRLLRADVDAIDDVRGWLIVVVSRLCVDQFRSPRRQRVDLGTDWDAIGVHPMADAADRVSLD